MAKLRPGTKGGNQDVTGSGVTFGRGAQDQTASNLSERFKNKTGLIMGNNRFRGLGSVKTLRDPMGVAVAGDFETLPEDLDLSELDLDDQLETIELKPPMPRPTVERVKLDGSKRRVDDELALALESRFKNQSQFRDLDLDDSDQMEDIDDRDDFDDSLNGDDSSESGDSARKNNFRPPKAAIIGIIVAVLLIVIIWGGLSTLSPPEAEIPPQVAEPVAEVETVVPVPVASPALPPPELTQGPLASEAQWRDNLVIDVYEVQSGGTLSQALERLSLSQEQRRSFYQVLETKQMLTKLMPGEEFSAWWATAERKPEDLERLEYRAVGARKPQIFLPGGPDGFYLVDLGSPSKFIHQAAEGTVAGTFWEAADKAGLQPWMIMRIVDLLASQIDFVSDIRTGDSFQLLFLGEYQDGYLVGKPIIETIRFTNKDERYEFYRYLNKEGEEGYFDAQFRSIKKTFFKSPLQYSRISSGFTKARMHPILKVVRPHLGVDYAAPTGTPVSAVADGVVNYAGFRGGYGRLVVLEHQGDIITMYGHLSVIAKGITAKVKVKQGDVIGNVGSSGLATGPHLDFRIRRKGEFVDPETVLSEQQGQPMAQEDRPDFAEKVTRDQELIKQLLAAE
ncbi:MAG: M23 family metallopeptidase [Deltaproteobacteria bacterium]|nr:M23 family metallopeptidase [Deltaproteobacteria bacterium]